MFREADNYAKTKSLLLYILRYFFWGGGGEREGGVNMQVDIIILIIWAMQEDSIL